MYINTIKVSGVVYLISRLRARNSVYRFIEIENNRIVLVKYKNYFENDEQDDFPLYFMYALHFISLHCIALHCIAFTLALPCLAIKHDNSVGLLVEAQFVTKNKTKTYRS